MECEYSGVFEQLAAMNFALRCDLELVKNQNSIRSNLIFDIDIDHQKRFMSSFSVCDLLTTSGPILITDQLASPGDFLLHQLLSEYVKSSPDGRCILHFSISGVRTSQSGSLEGHLVALSKSLTAVLHAHISFSN